MTDERDHVYTVARANGKKSTLSVAVSDSFCGGKKGELGYILAADPKQKRQIRERTSIRVILS